MESKEVLAGATVGVLLAVLGVIVMVGVILLMMWKQPGIARSPSEQSRISEPSVRKTAQPGATFLTAEGRQSSSFAG